MTTLTGPLADGVLASEGLTFKEVSALADAFVFSGVFSARIIPGGVVGETLTMHDTATALLVARTTVSERLRFASVLQLLQHVSVNDHMAITSALTGWFGALIRDGFSLGGIVSTAFTYRMTITQALRIAEAIESAHGATIFEKLSMASAISLSYTAGAHITEALALSGLLSDHLVVRLVFTDGIVLKDAEILRMIYRQTMPETLLMQVIYQSLGSNVTTWAINTRTNSVTQYENFSLNSFATNGNKYLGADQNGLYELNGDLDVTQQVMARVGGGYFQANGSKFAGLKGVYLGAQGQGSYLLKIITGDGISRIYRTALNPGLMTTKVNIGKGIKARYIAWELINENGQNFDLDSIEFVPMMSGRRV